LVLPPGHGLIASFFPHAPTSAPTSTLLLSTMEGCEGSGRGAKHVPVVVDRSLVEPALWFFFFNCHDLPYACFTHLSNATLPKVSLAAAFLFLDHRALSHNVVVFFLPVA